MAYAYPDNTDIERLNFLTRIKVGVLRAHGFAVVGDLRHAKDAELLRVPGIGKVTVGDIRATCGTVGPDEPPMAQPPSMFSAIERSLTTIASGMDRIDRLVEAQLHTMQSVHNMEAAFAQMEMRFKQSCKHDFVMAQNGARRMCLNCGHVEVPSK